MASVKLYKNTDIDVSISQVKKNMGITGSNDLDNEIKSCIMEMRENVLYKVCYDEYVAILDGDEVNFGFKKVTSRDLSSFLDTSGRVMIFVATLGIGIDRLLEKYGKTSITRCFIIQAVATEMIEGLCDRFMDDMGKFEKIRFSPGYGDLSLSFQKDIFDELKPFRNIGVSLSSSLLMTPVKSVSAIFPLSL